MEEDWYGYRFCGNDCHMDRSLQFSLNRVRNGSGSQSFADSNATLLSYLVPSFKVS